MDLFAHSVLFLLGLSMTASFSHLSLRKRVLSPRYRWSLLRLLYHLYRFLSRLLFRMRVRPLQLRKIIIPSLLVIAFALLLHVPLIPVATLVGSCVASLPALLRKFLIIR